MRDAGGRMPVSLQYLRRQTTQLVIDGTLKATAALPTGWQAGIVSAAMSSAVLLPMLRARVADNMRLALGSVPDHADRRYFAHVAWFLSNALVTYHHGLTDSVVDTVQFGASVQVLDEAMQAGRGVVLASPHWTGHELMAAAVNRRYPTTMLVREAPTAQRMARKIHWYKALGAEIVVRPARASEVKDAVAYLKILKRGRLLGITPDLLAGGSGRFEALLFGRRAQFQGGAFALAIAAGAPVICPSFEWQADGRLIATLERLPLGSRSDDLEAQTAAAVQGWCRWFEGKLATHPENWLFWLDRRWSHFLRTAPRGNTA